MNLTSNQRGMMTLLTRQADTCIGQFPVIQGIFAAALTLKNATVKAQVMAVLMAGLDNADDTATPGYYYAECKRNLVDFVRDFPTRQAFWESMFFGSCQSKSTERYIILSTEYLHGQAERWLQARGLLG